jgi:hypothetical protein
MKTMVFVLLEIIAILVFYKQHCLQYWRLSISKGSWW